MEKGTNIIIKAEFNPKIKTYILLTVAFFLVISLAGIPFLIIWFLGLGQHISKRYYQNLRCQLTTKHLEFKKGVLFKVEKTIPLENIQDLTFIENPILNILDLRILKIETAGQSNPKGSDMKLIGIIDSANFKESVLKQREAIQSKNYSLNQTSDNSTEKTHELLEEIRDLLNDIKNK
ncbi:PH domain-containing protein [Seonamhaeicola maritimus]|uniref:PH domain-containing protein n=1 Tax=Seonamhaeicola maritimus TaxID=2591822 RepID=A0A5C7GM78_9FLAO|nr:PH domain-containing protein [Seonamhaeicola maritimus]TXG39432.1 PH domain-containing protein [Seonamhaeicola maritimus]